MQFALHDAKTWIRRLEDSPGAEFMSEKIPLVHQMFW